MSWKGKLSLVGTCLGIGFLVGLFNGFLLKHLIVILFSIGGLILGGAIVAFILFIFIGKMFER